MEFFMHGEALRHQVKKQARLRDKTVQQFHQIINFQIDSHHILLQLRQDPQRQFSTTHILLNEEEVEAIIQDWLKEWHVPILDDQLDVDEYLVQENPTSQKDADQGGYPQEETQDPNTPQNDSSKNLIDPVIEEKRKQTDIEQVDPKNKKIKDEKTLNTINLDGEYFTHLTKALEKVAQGSFKKIDELQMELIGSVTNLLMMP